MTVSVEKIDNKYHKVVFNDASPSPERVESDRDKFIKLVGWLKKHADTAMFSPETLVDYYLNEAP